MNFNINIEGNLSMEAPKASCLLSLFFLLVPQDAQSYYNAIHVHHITILMSARLSIIASKDLFLVYLLIFPVLFDYQQDVIMCLGFCV